MGYGITNNSNHEGKVTDETHAAEKAVLTELRRAGSALPKAASGFIRAVSVPDIAARLTKAVEILFGVKIVFVNRQ